VERLAKRVTCAHFVFLVAPRQEPGPARLGLVVSRKVGNAVARNRVKRVCRECFRHGHAAVPEGIDLVIVARAGAAELDFAAASREWADVQRLLVKRATEALAQSPPRPHALPHSGGPS
jgi:ribonuclease P protein component